MTIDQQLAHCSGYDVETDDGRIGTVAAVLPRAGRLELGLLLVHTGRSSCELATVAFDEVDAVDASHRRVLLGGSPRTMREGAPSGARDRIVNRA